MKASISDSGIFSPRTEKRRLSWSGMRRVAYWICTLLVASEMMAGGVWNLLRVEYVRGVLAHLGYPMYLLTILGIWKIPCALVLLVPRFLRVKEWAYAGAFFTFSGAVASHAFSGDGVALWTPPLILAVLTLASWALRPAERRIASSAETQATGAAAWAVPVLIAVALLILSFVTLPEGPPPM